MKAVYIFAVGFLAVAVILAVRIAGTGAGEDRSNHGGTETRSSEEKKAGFGKKKLLTLDSRLLTSSGAGAVRPLKVGDTIPDATLTDQDGRGFQLSALKGKPFVLTFIYTECNMPTMCPSTTEKLVKVRDLSLARGQGDAQIVIVSFDPERDKPSRLKQFAKGYTTDFSGFRLATGAAAEIAPLARLLNTYYSESRPGVFAHNIVVSIVDRTGALRDQFFGNTWEPREVAESLAKTASVASKP